jgi:DNA primase large subunit
MVYIGYFFHLRLALENNKDFVLKKKNLYRNKFTTKKKRKRRILMAFLMGNQGQKIKMEIVIWN